MRKNAQQILDKYYDLMFKELCDSEIDFGEIAIEITVTNDGTTVRRSWKERDRMLAEANSDHSS